MEQLDLAQFYRKTDSWPKSRGALGELAESLRSLTGAPVVLVSLGTDTRAAGLDQAGDPEEAEWSARTLELLRRQNESKPFSPLRLMQLSDESALRRGDRRLCHLVSATIRDEGASLGEFLLVLEKQPNQLIESLLIAAARHLGSLSTQQKLRQSIQLRDQFLSIASHELKTPLTSIYGILQLQERMLRARPGETVLPEQEKQHGFFKIVIRQVERLNELIDGLLDVSRIQNGRFNVEPSDSEISALVKDTVSRLRVIAQEAGVRINTEVPEAVHAWIDPVRFEEVVTNLGMNAIRFSPEGGTVWIKVNEDLNQLVLSVRDQGPAVPEPDRRRIFEPFEKAQRTSRLGGLGLGLFISRQIAQLHGGTLTLSESLPGKGNVFEARFPLRRPTPVATTPPSAA